MVEAEILCERIGVFVNGRLQCVGTCEVSAAITNILSCCRFRAIVVVCPLHCLVPVTALLHASDFCAAAYDVNNFDFLHRNTGEQPKDPRRRNF